MKKDTVIRHEADSDRAAIRSVIQAAFGTVVEADMVDALRDGGFVKLSLVAEQDERIVGHVLFSSISVATESGNVEAVALAPMAVLPGFQRQGIGHKLVKAGIEACRAQGHRFAVVLGHPDFYPRFGFNAELAKPLHSPFGGGEAWMALEFEPNALFGVSGKVKFAQPFSIFE